MDEESLVTLSQRISSHIFVIFVFFLFLCLPECYPLVKDTESLFPSTKNIFIKYNSSNTTYEEFNSIKSKQTEVGTSIIHSGEAFDGYNIFQFRNFTNREYNFRITDMEGKIIQEFPGNNTFSYGHLINSTTLLLQTLGGLYFWNIENGHIQRFTFGSHHDISYNPRTKTFMTLKGPIVYQGQSPYRYDVIQEINFKGEIVWLLDTSTFIPF
ncbi:MAG: hypothetical protein ACFFDC_20600, partial [Promethearchaeota archaeon]